MLYRSPKSSISLNPEAATSGSFSLLSGTTILGGPLNTNQGNIDINAGATLQVQTGKVLQLNDVSLQ